MPTVPPKTCVCPPCTTLCCGWELKLQTKTVESQENIPFFCKLHKTGTQTMIVCVNMVNLKRWRCATLWQGATVISPRYSPTLPRPRHISAVLLCLTPAYPLWFSTLTHLCLFSISSLSLSLCHFTHSSPCCRPKPLPLRRSRSNPVYHHIALLFYFSPSHPAISHPKP